MNLLRRHGISPEAALIGDFERSVEDALRVVEVPAQEPSRGLASHSLSCICEQCEQAHALRTAARYVHVVAMPLLSLDQWAALPYASQLAIVELMAPVLQGGALARTR